MSRFRPLRVIGATVGALVILSVGVYGPATLLGPLPAATATVVTPAAGEAVPFPPVLPATGGSAVIGLATVTPDPAAAETSETPVAPVLDAAALATTQPLAVAGTADPLPMAAATKIVTALVVLDAKPLAPGDTGPQVPITAADYQNYIDYGNSGARTVVVFPGELWNETELLQAMILGSSNNHADTLARWAFGSLDAYTAAANAWLAEQGLDGTSVADATGLSDDSVGTATDLARLAGLAAADPVIGAILSQPASALVGQRGVDNTTAFLPEEGVTGITRSYTDGAGVCFLFTGQVQGPDSVYTFAGALLGEPDYDTLTSDVTALMESARAGVRELPTLAQGDAYVEFSTPWGAEASGTVRTATTTFGWQAQAPGEVEVTVEPLSTGRAGKTVGRVTVEAGGADVTSTLVLDRTISAPVLGWRLLHPVPMITALVAANR
jgi:D-alanyl-D-alanine carboxypeptidase (penicillin-binding protein 5/6)